jgi:putative tricarboxylic transport membrane protein
LRLNDAILGLALILLAAWVIYLTAAFPAFPGQDYGPSLFPRVIATGVILCGAGLVWRGLAARRAGGGAPWVELAPWVRQGRSVVSFLAMLAAMGFYLVASDLLGFIPTAVVLLLGLFMWFGVRVITAVPVAIGMTLLVHWFFSSLMRVPLPRGVLDPVL